MNFGALNRLEIIRGEGGTRIRFEPGKSAPAGSLAQETTADRLVASVDPRTETIRAVEQSGNFQFREGERHATADHASYQTSTQSLALTGKPQVRDLEMRARANKILMDLASGRAEGLGKVESTHTGSASRGEPTNVLADRVVAERRSQTVRYDGHVRAWRGSDVVESDALEILRAERRVRSGSKVLTSHLQPAAAVGDASAKGGPSATRPATIRADHLEYSDEGRKATYRGNVRMQTENATLEADRLDATFKESGSATELERAIADGNVKVTQPGRRATGRHAEYFSKDGRIVLTGGPPALYDAEKGFTSGQSLTFYSHDDRLIVSGGEESTTISRHRIGQ
jgi:lipopolysaccharide export system protein LptA